MHLGDPLDEIPTTSILDLRERVVQGLEGTSIDREQDDGLDALVDVVDALTAINSTVDRESDRFLMPPVDINNTHRLGASTAYEGPRLVRDRTVVLEVARYRLVSFTHLREFIFAGAHAAVVTRRMRALRSAGFLATWEERLPVGGHPHYALLTDKGMRWAMDALRSGSSGLAHEQLVLFMLRSRPRKPLALVPNTAPPFLPHQNETNRIVATLARRPALGIVWSSTWHRPFPNEVRGVPMPQPDGVLVATVGGVPQLVFVEHDRAKESPGSFAERKTRRYQLLLDLGLARELFGFDSFTVLVTVTDPAERQPFDRIRALQEVSIGTATMRFAPPTGRFALLKRRPGSQQRRRSTQLQWSRRITARSPSPSPSWCRSDASSRGGSPQARTPSWSQWLPQAPNDVPSSVK